MLSHNINPIIFKVGFIQVTYYALVYLVGFLLALWLLLKAVKRKKIKMEEAQVYNLILFSVIGLILGARIFHVIFWGLGYYWESPIKIFYLWEGGFSFHGALVGTLLTAGFYCKYKKINFWKIADFFALLGIIMGAFLRITNFINQEIVGTITKVPWCFNFKYHEGCRHPVQLFAAAGRFVFFFLLLGIKKKLGKFKDGLIFWCFIFGIGFGRFFLDFLREDIRYSGLAVGQWFSLGMVLVSALVLWKIYRKELRKIINFNRV